MRDKQTFVVFILSDSRHRPCESNRGTLPRACPIPSPPAQMLKRHAGPAGRERGETQKPAVAAFRLEPHRTCSFRLRHQTRPEPRPAKAPSEVPGPPIKFCAFSARESGETAPSAAKLRGLPKLGRSLCFREPRVPAKWHCGPWGDGGEPVGAHGERAAVAPGKEGPASVATGAPSTSRPAQRRLEK